MNSLANLIDLDGTPSPMSLAGADVTATLILAPIADPIDEAAHGLELAGLIFALLTGLHPLAIISAKLLARDAIDQAITSTFAALLKTVGEAVGGLLGSTDAADHLTAAKLLRAAEITSGAKTDSHAEDNVKNILKKTFDDPADPDVTTGPATDSLTAT